MKAVGYIRVSTEEQATHGVSLDSQRERIEAWTEFKQAELLEVFEDAGISGYRSDNRPGVLAAMELSCREQATLVVYSLSRLARNTLETLQLAQRIEKAGANIVSLSEPIDTTTAMGKAFFSISAVFQELERNQIAERVSVAMAYRKKQGLFCGTVPYGFTLAEDGDTLLPLEAEQEVIRLIQELRRQGLTLRAIRSELEQRGIRTKTGGSRWAPKVLASVCRREAAA